jgi:hypothetical protein
MNTKQTRYENIYRAVLNIKDYINTDICKKELNMQGQFNGFEYEAKCYKVKELRNYVIHMDEDTNEEGNIGNYLVQFYKIKLFLKQDNFQKEYKYYKTVIKSLS